MTETSKSKKQRHAGSKIKPSSCGTLAYLAECRGVVKKTDVTRLTASPEGINKFVRKYPTAS